jgi:hypothetical protein
MSRSSSQNEQGKKEIVPSAQITSILSLLPAPPKASGSLYYTPGSSPLLRAMHEIGLGVEHKLRVFRETVRSTQSPPPDEVDSTSSPMSSSASPLQSISSPRLVTHEETTEDEEVYQESEEEHTSPKEQREQETKQETTDDDSLPEWMFVEDGYIEEDWEDISDEETDNDQNDDNVWVIEEED